MPNPGEKTPLGNSEDPEVPCSPGKARQPEETPRGDVPSLCPPAVPPSSPPQALSMAELLETAQEVSRMTIAHEIVLNHDFKVQQVNFAPNSLESRVKETLHKAFWDSLKERLSTSPPDYTHAIRLLQEIKETLLSLLLPRQTRLRSQIEAALDMELIRQEAEHGALDIPSLTMYILSTMAMLCAPIRDEEVQRLRSLTDPVQLLREIFRVLDLMKMDMVNFTIQSLRPHLQDRSIEYEQKKFQELLDKLPSSLDHTTEWLRKAAADASASPLLPPSQPESNIPPASSLQGAAHRSSDLPSPTSVLNQGYMSLLHWEPGQEKYPETLLMDQARLQEVRSQVNRLTIIAAVLLVTTGVCGSALCSSPGFVDRLKRVTEVLLEGLPHTRFEEALLDIGHQVCQEASRTLSQLGCPPLSSDKTASLKGQIKSITDKDNAVRSVMEQRIHSFLSLCLSPNEQNSLENFPKGLAPIREELREVGRRFGSVTHHNRQVFGPYYSGILKKVLLPEVEPEAGIDSF
ncbi:PREDICTED: T-complex protein 11 homolog [Gavialis gangeticus]|uniref:T-complex protein 11 homolog n=1 Tax=Gavialis gangeticus TaxID=94835 RepID=UPI00092EA8A5|nr:PREDICTED: T-complex protein 11 homolog [Gavialis gangeticus]XP_019369708.1 PREDICTED: T-complex protein 11 homolog [Gavialis gangeticus]